ncbi:hypothetical protein EZS27_001743 [termite gut metagenome]|jgi:hypothetical protein|uniref:DUF5675 domain-containing protein n=1 Tax=termite gut metagenome TaxID=433724 RepID=A0A5J4SXD5_9ZZZZ
MKITVKRRFLGETYTIGSLFVNGVYFCDTLEDKVREKKVMHQTAIPYGTYQVIVNLSPSKKRMLPRLLGVPHFEGILIHRGNTAEDSSGCIIVGENKVKGKVIHSTPYEERLTQLCREAQNRKEEIKIEIV